MTNLFFVTSDDECSRALLTSDSLGLNNVIVLGFDATNGVLLDFNSSDERVKKWSDYYVYNVQASNFKMSCVVGLNKIFKEWLRYKIVKSSMFNDLCFQFSVVYKLSKLYVSPIILMDRIFLTINPSSVYMNKLSKELELIIGGMKQVYGYELYRFE
jgi:hypothetical protein